MTMFWARSIADQKTQSVAGGNRDQTAAERRPRLAISPRSERVPLPAHPRSANDCVGVHQQWRRAM